MALGAFVNGLYWCLEYPCRRTLLGEIAGLEQVGAAMGLDSSSNNATRMLGPVLGGALFELFALPGPYLLGAVLYTLALWSALTIGFRSAVERTTQRSVLEILREGFGYLRNNRLVAGVLVVTVLLNFFGFAYGAMIPVIGEGKFGLSAFPIGILASMEGLGAIIGGVGVATLVRPAWFIRVFMGGSFLFLIMVVSFSFSPGFLSSLPLLFGSGVGIVAFASMQTALVFSATEARMRRRVMGVLVVCIGTGPLGVLHTGLLASWLGADVAVRIIGIEGLVALAAAVWFWPELIKPTVFPVDDSACTHER